MDSALFKKQSTPKAGRYLTSDLNLTLLGKECLSSPPDEGVAAGRMLILVSLLPASSGVGSELIWKRGYCHSAFPGLGVVYRLEKDCLEQLSLGFVSPEELPTAVKLHFTFIGKVLLFGSA